MSCQDINDDSHDSVLKYQTSTFRIHTQYGGSGLVIDLFTDTAAILNLLDLRSIMGCPGGHSLSIYARFSGKKRTSLSIYRAKGDHYYIQKRHNDLFFPLQSFLGKFKEKLARKARINAERVYWIMLMPPGHSIILLK